MARSTLAMIGVLASTILHGVGAFNPREYIPRSANCPALDRALGKSVNITIEYFDINPGARSSILMVHGWPSLWSSWGRQIDAFKDSYRLVALNIRGFGGSTHPDDVQSSSTLADIAEDLNCVLKHAGIPSSICLGHDWGAEVCYEAARRRPDLFHAVVGVTVPYLHAAVPFLDSIELTAAMPKLAYQIFFERNTSDAIAELDMDIRRTLRATMRSVESPPPDHFLTRDDTFIGTWNEIQKIPPVPFLTDVEEDYLVEQFCKQGFKYTLLFYTRGNRYGTWQATRLQGNYTIPQPVLSILPLDDPVADWVFASSFLDAPRFLPALTLRTMRGAHWPHMEYPDVFNTILKEWLDSLQEKTEPGSVSKFHELFLDEL